MYNQLLIIQYSIADTNGNVISWASAGQKGFKGSRKSTHMLHK